MNLTQFLELDDDDISPENAQLLNMDLATKSVSSIPESRCPRVLEYLVTALNVNSVEPDIQAKLDSLVADLQKS